MPSLDFQNGFILGLASKGKAKQRTIIQTEKTVSIKSDKLRVTKPTKIPSMRIEQSQSENKKLQIASHVGLPIGGLTAYIVGDGTAGSVLSLASDDFDITRCNYQWFKAILQPDIKYAHTPNISDDGVQNGDYGNSYSNTQVITIPGAEQLNVTLKYGTESISYDWVSVFAGNYPNYNANSSGYIKKLGGADSEVTFTVEGDSVTFAFRSDGSGAGSGYGYYAVIEGVGLVRTNISTEAEYTVIGDESNIACTLSGARGLIESVTTDFLEITEESEE